MRNQKIVSTGFYDDIPPDFYHGDLCALPSLSSSGAIEIINTCPAKFFAGSYLGRSAAREHRQEFDIGTAAHLALLEPARWDAHVEEIEADDYRTKAAREARDAAYAAGKTPLRPKDIAKVRAMHDALIRDGMIASLISRGVVERSFVFHDVERGIFLKARPDIIHHADGGATVIDYKTTANAHPRAFQRSAAEYGYERQDAWYRHVIGAVLGIPVARFVFLAQETAPPYLSSVFEFDSSAVEWGAIQNAKAIEKFCDGLKSGVWPGYGTGVHKMALPSYVEFRLEEQKLRGEFSVSSPANTGAFVSDDYRV